MQLYHSALQAQINHTPPALHISLINKSIYTLYARSLPKLKPTH